MKKIYNILKVLFIISIFIFSKTYIQIIGPDYYLLLKIYYIAYIICKIFQLMLEIYFNLTEK